MNKFIEDFRIKLLKNNCKTSLLEFTEGNYDRNGKLIKSGVPTITTDFCEIGGYKDKMYFVFVVISDSFNLSFFDRIKDLDIEIYGFRNFKDNLFPAENFDVSSFVKDCKREKYLQLQFNFDKMDVEKLFREYKKVTNIFQEFKIQILNQLEIDLTKF